MFGAVPTIGGAACREADGGHAAQGPLCPPYRLCPIVLAMADLTIDDIALRYGESDILKGVSVAVPSGKVVALLGPSGSGKTTLLRAVAGLETPHRGAIRIGEKVLFDAARRVDLPAEERGLGLVFQSYALCPHRTVFGNVAYGLN